MSITPNASVLSIEPYIGGDITPPGMTRRIVLASNENPLGPSPEVLKAYASTPLNFAAYPSGNATQLRHAIAHTYDVSLDHIVCGNGSEDLIHLLCRVYLSKGDEAIVPEHGFLAYPIAIQASNATCVKVPQPHLCSRVDTLLEHITPRTKMIFLDNPGNPLGCLMPKEEVLRLHSSIPSSVLLILDEAYAEYLENNDSFESGLTLFKNAQNVVVLRTFSKMYGLAGLRLGWAYSSLSVLEFLNRVRQPFNVNSIVQNLGIHALKDQEWVQKVRSHNTLWRQWTYDALTRLRLRPLESYGNFILFDCKTPENTTKLYTYLGQKGILLRPVKAYGLHHHLRISIGAGHHMEECVTHMEEFFRINPFFH